MLGFGAIASAALAATPGPSSMDVAGFAPVTFGFLTVPQGPYLITGFQPMGFGTPAIAVDWEPEIPGFRPAAFGSPSMLRFTSASARRIRIRMSGFAAPRFGKPTL